MARRYKRLTCLDDLFGAERLARAGEEAQGVEPYGNLGVVEAFLTQQQDVGSRPLVVLVGLCLSLASVPTLSGGRRREVGRRAQLCALRFLDGESSLRALGTEFALVLSEHGDGVVPLRLLGFAGSYWHT